MGGDTSPAVSASPEVSQPSSQEQQQQPQGGRKSAKDRLGVKRPEAMKTPKEEEEDDNGGSEFTSKTLLQRWNPLEATPLNTS